MSDDSVINRGAAIFDQLRREEPDDSTPDAAERDEPATDEALVGDGALDGPEAGAVDAPATRGPGPDLEIRSGDDATPGPGDAGAGSPGTATEPEVEDPAAESVTAGAAPTEPSTGIDDTPTIDTPSVGPAGRTIDESPATPAPAAFDDRAPEGEDGPSAEQAPAPPAAEPAPPPAPARPRLPLDLPTPSAAPPATPAATAAAERAEAPARTDAAGNTLPRVLAVANQKGGVGKTTTAVNLGAALAEAGYRTLVVDLDPQGNASTGLGINIRDLQLSMYDVIIHEASIDDTIEATAMKNLFVAPASLDLAGAEIELVPAFSRELRLRSALAEVHDDYDYVLIDCPPSLGLITVNGLAAAGEVVVPIQCEYYALEGLGQLLRNVSLVQRSLNPTLEISTFVCVMYDARTKLADQVVAEVREHFGDRVCRIVIPRTVRLSEAPSYGQPILAFDPRSRGAIAYRELAREVSGGPQEDR